MKLFLTYLLILSVFSGFAQQRYDILITEFMADPAPAVGLPSYEWIEIRNVSTAALQMQGWRLGDASSMSGPFPPFLIQPDSFLILCPASALTTMLSFGSAIAVPNFPSLDNESETVFIQSPDGRAIHGIEYHASWYDNTLKQEGGWTLEMIDKTNPCTGKENWKASADLSGGTPGRNNANEGLHPDSKAPRLLYAITTDSNHITLIFDEPLDSSSASHPSPYTIDGGLAIDSAILLPPLYNRVSLHTDNLMNPGLVYSIAVDGVADCMQQGISSAHATKTGIPGMAVEKDCIINEILFNPRSSGHDFVEIYNRSQKILDASTLYLTNRSAGGSAGTPRRLIQSARYLFPGEYLVVTPEPEQLSMHYFVKDPDQVFGMTSFPSFPDDEGTVVLMNGSGDIIDEVHYSDDWHFKLISNAEGISLERIDPESESQQMMTWHSAGSTSGYGTPTARNSQFQQDGSISGSFEIFPKVFSPDNDGHDDRANLQYQMEKPGFMATVTIFDMEGRPVRHLIRNELAGLKGSWNWDGLGDHAKKLPAGRYIVHASFFDLEGKRLLYKKTVVLGRAFT